MNIRNIQNSIVTRLLVLASILVVIGAVVRYYAITNFLKDDFGQVVETQQLALATYVARDVEEKIAQRRALLDRLAAALPDDLLSRPDRLRTWLAEHYEYQPLFSAGLFVVNPKGVAIADYPVLPSRATTDYSDRDYIQAGLAGESFIGRPLVGRAAKEPVLPMSSPVRDARGRVVGVLAGITGLADPAFLSTLLQSRIGNTTGGFLLVSPRDRLFVAASQPDLILKPIPAEGSNALQDKAMGGYRGTGMTVSSDGVEEIAAIASVPSTGWYVVARIPSQEAFATVEHMKSFLASGAVVTFIVFAITAGIGLYFVFRPLAVAARQADRMTRGEAPLEPLPIRRNDEIGHFIAAFNRLLTRLETKQEELRHLAQHDPLTGLPNRALCHDRLGQALAKARRNDLEVAVLFLDLDGFKQINDRLGHAGGDEALQMVAARVSELLRESDTLSRVGGDEFVLLPSDAGSHAEQAAITIATKCIDALHQPLVIAGQQCRIGVSIGIVLGKPDHSADEFMTRADAAMYEAKKAGRGRYSLARI